MLAGCTFGQAPPPTPLPLIPATPIVPVVTGPAYTVSRGPVIDEITYPGKVNLATVEDLFFNGDGRVENVYMADGDSVAAGDLIAELDVRSLNYDLELARLEQKLAEDRLNAATVSFRFDQLTRQIALQREKLLLAVLQANPDSNPGEVSLQELAVRQADLAVQMLEGGPDAQLQIEFERAKVSLRRLEAALAEARITAPFAGEVRIFDSLRRGKAVKAYEPVASLVDPNAIVVEANLVPGDLANLTEGMLVKVAPSSALDNALDGEIQTLPQPFGSGLGSTTRIGLAADVAEAQLRPGMNVEITVRRGGNNDALWLPPAAVQGYKDNYYVRRRDGSEQPVVVGIWGPERVEIRSGLAEGQEVVGK